jgi:hypothetical protein
MGKSRMISSIRVVAIKMPESEIKEQSPSKKGRESEISDSGCDLETSGPGLLSMTRFEAVKGNGEHKHSS